MEKPTINCVIPTHGRDHLLLKALESVRLQTRQPERVTVVDDTGSESTRVLVSGFVGLPCIAYLDNSGAEHPGASSSRNAGAWSAESDFLAFLDDDDRWEPEFLEESLAAIGYSGADLATAPGTVEFGSGFAERPWLAKRVLTHRECLAWNPGITGSSFVISAESFRSIGGFDERLPVFNDLDLFVRFLARNYKYTVLTAPRFIQTADGAGHLSSRNERRARGVRMYMEKHRAELRWHQRRRLLREIHLSKRYKGQALSLRAYHFVVMWLLSSPTQFIQVLRAKISGRGTMYA
ncbi:glycosyltransferase family 2 protein [Pseudarthrobacter sp. NPDC092424]|uniref:glycosyltransferase family 2 protein n=1 Tax=Pseudarthrobacter sp. NPDC092424 TaxID=3364415 RepID=UPI0038201EBE